MNKEVVFQGKASWNSLTQVDKYGKASIKLYLTDASKTLLQDLQAEDGILTRLSRDDDGYYANFGRHPKKVYGAKEIIFGYPQVFERDGKSPYSGRIGHGSDVSVTCEVYPYTIPASQGKKGKALRLSSVRVDNLVPFNAEEHSNEYEAHSVKALANVAPQPLY